MIDCTEMESAACADPQMESIGTGRCCITCISLSSYSAGEDHY